VQSAALQLAPEDAASYDRARSVFARNDQTLNQFLQRLGKLAMMFKTGQKVPESGIYRVVHEGHRLPHEVTLLKGEAFPRCSKCADQVGFEALSLAPALLEKRGGIVVYELPEIEKDKPKGHTA
jgi:hypothetical protein